MDGDRHQCMMPYMMSKIVSRYIYFFKKMSEYTDHFLSYDRTVVQTQKLTCNFLTNCKVNKLLYMFLCDISNSLSRNVNQYYNLYIY